MTRLASPLIAAAALLMAITPEDVRARDTADIFASAPAQIFPLLDRNARLDMVDYYRSHLSTPSANALDGKSAITEMTPGSLTVRMTDSSTAQIFLLQAGSDTIVGVISTVATPGLDSNIAFYDTSWRQQPQSRFFAKPGWKEWLAKGGDLATVTSMTPFMLASYVYDPASSTLTLTNNLSRFLDEDIYTTIAPELRGALTYTWSGKKFDRKE